MNTRVGDLRNVGHLGVGYKIISKWKLFEPSCEVCGLSSAGSSGSNDLF